MVVRKTTKDIFGWGIDKYGGNIQYAKPPYQVGDILWVRETWCDRWLPDGFLQGNNRYGYKADGTPSYGYWGNDNQCKNNVWRPSIHMPKVAARIFLKVTNVKVHRVQDITEDESKKEGIKENFPPFMIDTFRDLRDSLYKNWSKNPWVWVIEFERINKPNN